MIRNPKIDIMKKRVALHKLETQFGCSDVWRVNMGPKFVYSLLGLNLAGIVDKTGLQFLFPPVGLNLQNKELKTGSREQKGSLP